MRKCVRTKERDTKKKGGQVSAKLLFVLSSRSILNHSSGRTMGKSPPLKLLDDTLRALLAASPSSFDLSCLIVPIAVVPQPNRRAAEPARNLAYDTF